MTDDIKNNNSEASDSSNKPKKKGWFQKFADVMTTDISELHKLKEEWAEVEKTPTESVVSENVSAPETTVEDKPGEEKPPSRENLLQKLSGGLKATREKVSVRIHTIAAARKGVDDSFYDEIQQVLIETDMGYEVAEEVLKMLRREVGARGADDTAEACDLLVEVIGRTLSSPVKTLVPDVSSPNKPVVILMTGVNGSGKTTVCGKLAKRYRLLGLKVLIVASDTFRAAAIDQLKIWAERAEVDFQGAKEGADPSSVVYDGLSRAKSEGHDIVIIDTAGRLQNKVNLMNELGKIRRTVDKQIEPDAIQSLLVIDSTTGQNAITQAEVFGEVAKLDGIILTKLDGTARGGIVLAIKQRMGLPVLEVGVGETINDLVPFDAAEYSRSLLGALADDDIDWRAKIGVID
ncbi:MAG: signal recognition particle-docking protein FtsY [bacterium]|nr:signal recognition particle-docking protein FtsY [bacterium]